MNISIIDDEQVDESKGGMLSHVSFVFEVNDLREFAEVGILQHIAPATFKDNRKRQDHLEQIQFICFDFDNGEIKSEDIHKVLKRKYNHVILGSKIT